MNHDELLTKINANLCGRDGCDGEHYKKDGLHGEWFALRVVVELHKPKSSHPDGWHEEIHCAQGDDQFHYPCSTIQAIEKELGNG